MMSATRISNSASAPASPPTAAGSDGIRFPRSLAALLEHEETRA
jgi:hypothetical protein